MKKHKSVIAILLSVMMIFTMMPMMAFAAGEDDPNAPDWASDYSTVKVGGHTYTAERNFVASDGTMIATADTSQVEGAPTIEPVRYYDLSAAEFAFNANTVVKSEYLKPGDWTGKGTVTGFVVKAPSYAKNKATATGSAFVALADLNAGSWKGEIKGADKYDSTKATEDQELTISLSVSYVSSTANALPVIGTPADKKVKIYGRDGEVTDAYFALDKVTKDNRSKDVVTTYYDGAEHTLVMSDVKGLTVKYTVFNKETGAWDSVDAVKVTNVADQKSVRAQLYDKDGKKVEDPYTLTVGITANPYAPVFGFTATEDEAETQHFEPAVYFVEGTEYDAASYVETTAVPYDKYEDGAAVKAAKAAAKKAVAANEAALKAFFNDFFEITAKAGLSNPNKISLKIEAKDLSALSDEEMEALLKKHEAVISNFALNAESRPEIIADDDAILYTNAVANDFEVEFTKAITKKTYKGKKAIKSGKLKKNQSFTVKAVANNGADIAYKLVNVESPKIKINKTTGKVTLKKGLKKGTYKIKIKAYVPGASNVAYEYQTVKVVIKKK